MAICVGCGLEVAAGILQVDLRPNGGIACDPDGVDSGLFLQTFHGNCLSGTGTQADPLDARISAAACNALECRADGLFAPCPQSIIGISVGVGSSTPMPVDTVGPNTNYIWEADQTINICNTTCFNISGRVSIQVGGLLVDADPGYIAAGILEVNTNGAGFLGAFPQTDKRVHNNHDVNNLTADFNNIEDNVLLSLTPAQCASYLARFRINVISGATPHGLVTGDIGFEIQWELMYSDPC